MAPRITTQGDVKIVELSEHHRIDLANCPPFRKYDSQWMYCGRRCIVVLQRNGYIGNSKKYVPYILKREFTFTGKILHTDFKDQYEVIKHFTSLPQGQTWALRQVRRKQRGKKK